MLKSVSNRNSALACLADCPADNQLSKRAQFLYETLSLIMKNALFILFLSISWWSSGQTTYADLDLTKDSDTLFWQKYKLEEIKDFNLPQLDTTSDFVFRRWNSGSLLEIKKDKDTISGKIIYFVFEVWEARIRF